MCQIFFMACEPLDEMEGEDKRRLRKRSLENPNPKQTP